MNRRQSYAATSPEKMLCEFLFAWKSRQWGLMAYLADFSRFKDMDALMAAEILYRRFSLDGGVIQRVDYRPGSRIAKARLKLFLQQENGGAKEIKISFMLFRKYEGGRWYVEPLNGVLYLYREFKHKVEDLPEDVKGVISKRLNVIL